MKRIAILLLAFAATPAYAGFTSFDAPGGGTEDGKGTYVNASEPGGIVTGNVISAAGATSGFTRLPDGQLVVFNAAEGADTHAIDINLGAAQTGYYIGSDAHLHGFVRTLNGDVTSFDPKDSAGTQAISINRGGDIAGQFTRPGGVQHGFLRKKSGKIAVFDGNADADTFGTFVTGVNANKIIAGYWFDGSSAMHGFLRLPDGTLVPSTPMTRAQARYRARRWKASISMVTPQASIPTAQERGTGSCVTVTALSKPSTHRAPRTR
jgi:hypothetical protein